MPRPKHAREADPADESVQETKRQTRSSTTKPASPAVVYGDHSSTYWPPGWNFKRYTEASTSDLAALPEEEMEKIRAGFREALGERGVGMLAKHLYEEERKRTMSTEDIAAERASLPPPNFITAYQQHVGEGPWGFVALRSSGYGDDEKWDRFKTRWEKIVHLPFRKHEGEDGVEAAEKKFEIRWIEEKDLHGKDAEVLRKKYSEAYPSLPTGLQQSVFLSVTDKVIDSVLENDEPDIASTFWRNEAPFVIVESPEPYPILEDDEETGGIRNSFKVALEVLADQFWPLVAADTGTLGNATRFLREDEIWWSNAPSPERLRRRRIARME